MKDWNVSAITRAFADAAVDPRRWDYAMETITSATNSSGAVLFPVKGTIPNLPMSASARLAMETYFRDRWYLREERAQAVPAMVKYGVADDFSFTTPEIMKRHPYYQEFLRPFGLQYFAGVKMATMDDLWLIAVQRSFEQGPFSPNEKQSLATLSTHVASAAALACAFGFARADAALTAFEVSGSAVVLLDRSAEVVRVNSEAEHILRSNPRIERRRIVSNDRNATAALDRTLHALLWNRDASALLPPVPLPRPDQRPILACPVRATGITADALAPCQALLVLVDSEKRVRPPEAALQTIFGLTPAEARLASRLAIGEAVETVSKTLGITQQTARSQLKRIFDKTGVHRQPELVSLLLSLIGPVIGRS
jgi:DNA-binding CsgD family transcriptional regulator